MHSYMTFNSPSFFTSTALLTTYQWPLLRAKATRGEAVACTLEPSEQAKQSNRSSAHTITLYHFHFPPASFPQTIVKENKKITGAPTHQCCECYANDELRAARDRCVACSLQ